MSPRRAPPKFDGMDPSEGAREMLRYLWETCEENAERIERLEKFFAPLYEMVFQIHRRFVAGAAPGVAGPSAAGPANPFMPPMVAAAARATTRVAAKKFFDFLAKKGVL